MARKVFDEVRVSQVTPQNGKKVVLYDVFGERYEMDNMNGITKGLVGSAEYQMLQNRSAFDAMVNAMIMLFGMELDGVEYYEVEKEEEED